MRLATLGAVTSLVVLAGSSAWAQTPAARPGSAAGSAAPTSTSLSAPTVNRWYAGATTGVAAVQKAGGTFSAEAGWRVYRNFDVSVEGGWFQNAVTRRVAGLTSPLTTFLQQSQGATATAVVKMPTAYFAVNGRWVFENQGRFRPYAVVGVGDARTTLKSSFALAGADITSSLGQYGVTLGSDLTGQTSHAAINAGAGVLVPLGKWFADAGLRVTSIRTAGQATNVVRFNIGGFARF